ncbi:MAG: DUF3737 family protein [Bacilli bacterium]
MKKINNQHFTGERALFQTSQSEIDNCVFDDGESPLKEACELEISNTVFGWKYPLWYGKQIKVRDSRFEQMGRAGIWYTQDSSFENIDFIAPKGFRKCQRISLKNIDFSDAEETLWWNDEVVLENITAKNGSYFGMGSSNMKIRNLNLTGDYPFDGAKHILIQDSKLISKDAFWNCEDIRIVNSTIEGEYFAWNSKNIVLENCRIKSHQGFCYQDGITLINCQVIDTDLAFEYCQNIRAEIVTSIDSVKNPKSGFISAKGIGQIIFDDEKIDKSKTIIEVR